MELLKLANKKFSSCALKVKLQLYLLPLLILVLIFVLYKEDKSLKIPSFTEIKTNYRFSSIDLISKIEAYTKNNNIQISTINIKDKTINISFKSKEKQMKKFLFFIENIDKNSSISSFEFRKEENMKYKNFLKANLKIDFKKTYNKKLQNEKVIKKEKNTKPILKAIVYDYAFLNNKWRIKGEEFLSYKIVKIDRNRVLLEKNKKIIELKVYDENSFK